MLPEISTGSSFSSCRLTTLCELRNDERSPLACTLPEGGPLTPRCQRSQSAPKLASCRVMDLSRALHLVVVFCLTWMLVKIIQLYRQRQALLKTMSSFPGAPTHWLYGHILEVLPMSRIFKKVESWSRVYPFAFPIWFGNFSACLIITHPDYAKTLLARAEPKDAYAYRSIVPWIGKGLLVLHGPKWMQHRKLLTPGFHYNILRPYVALMADSTKIMLDKWEHLMTQETSVDLFKHVSLMTLDSIMKCAFSYNSNCQMDRENAYVQAVFDLCFLINEKMYHILYQNDLIYWLSPQGYQFRKACQVAHRHTDKIIKERKEYLRNEEERQKIQTKRHLDFLDILLCAKDENGVGLSDEDLRAEVDTFMFEGHDTTASGISWMLYCLAQNPEHQQKCREEIKAILEDHDTIQWDDLSKMTYCTMCIKESFRLYPPVPGVSRQLSKPITFSDGRTVQEGKGAFQEYGNNRPLAACLIDGQGRDKAQKKIASFLAIFAETGNLWETIEMQLDSTTKAGSWVAISFYLMHRNPSIWKDPEVFDPLRFTPENISNRDSHAFLPFSAGPRNCIGQQFAMNEMKVALALTLLRFELIPDPAKPPPIPMPQLILRSHNGIHLTLKKIK